MKRVRGLYILLLSLSYLTGRSHCNRLKDRIYNVVESDTIHSCFRRLNGTTTIGCTSSVRGDVGVLMYLDTAGDTERLTDETFAPYIVMINPKILSGDLISRLEDTGLVTGIILPSVEDPEGRWYGQAPAGGFSDDSSAGGWNPAGSGVMWREFEFPIFYLPDIEKTEELYQCFLQHNNQSLAWPLCAVEMKANMHAATNSETCTRRSHLNNNLEPVHFCDPLADINIHYSLQETQTENKNVLLVTARLDTITMFDQTEVGFDSPVTGLVTFISAASLVATAMRSSQLTGQFDNVLFLLLNGESWDNIGSSRFLYDLEQGEFVTNLSLANIKTVLELGQLSNLHTDTVYLHTVNSPDDLVTKIQSLAASEGLTAVKSSSDSTPPSSIRKLVSALPSLKAVMMTNFDSEYSNKYYHSLYDTATRHGYNQTGGQGQKIVQHLSRVSLLVARTVLSITSDAEISSLSAQPELVDSLLLCYSVSANCTMFREASASDTGFPWTGPQVTKPFPQYVGVNVSPHARLTKQVLQLLTGSKVELEENKVTDTKKSKTEWQEAAEACLSHNSPESKLISYVYLVGPDCYSNNTVTCGQCYRTSVSESEAGSPVFIKENRKHYDWDSGQWPTWTESVWKGFSARSFLLGSPAHDSLVFGVGLSVFLLSLLLGWWIQCRAELLFSPSGDQIQLASPASLNT